jgi:hypothetical protein
VKDVYDLKSVKMPYLAGGALKLFASLVEGPLQGFLIPSLFESAGLNWLRSQRFDEPPTNLPIHYTGELQKEAASVPEHQWPRASENGKGFRFATIHDYAKAYRNGTTTPEEVAKKVLDAIEESNSATPPLRAVIVVDREDVMRQARESAERIKSGKPLSIFDGVPVAVKDEIDMTPYPTTVGTSFLGKAPVMEDATIVARLRSAGALLIGKTNMHEIGINVTGLNPITPNISQAEAQAAQPQRLPQGLCPLLSALMEAARSAFPQHSAASLGLNPLSDESANTARRLYAGASLITDRWPVLPPTRLSPMP